LLAIARQPRVGGDREGWRGCLRFGGPNRTGVGAQQCCDAQQSVSR
jgi:hypothetical protein